jgi:hypothetical protein
MNRGHWRAIASLGDGDCVACLKLLTPSPVLVFAVQERAAAAIAELEQQLAADREATLARMR